MNEFDKIWNETMGCGACDVKPSEDTEVIKVSKGAVKARQGRFVIYDVEWLKKNFYATEEKIYGQPKQPCEDAVSRQAAIDFIIDNYGLKCSSLTNGIRDYLPSVTPQIESSEDCISREAARKILSNEVFALMKLHTVSPEDNPRADAIAHGVNWSLNTLMELPSATPERLRGKWKFVQYDYNPNIGNWHCSECRNIVIECVNKNDKGGIPVYKYCPNCGAEMEVEE